MTVLMYAGFSQHTQFRPCKYDASYLISTRLFFWHKTRVGNYDVHKLIYMCQNRRVYGTDTAPYN